MPLWPNIFKNLLLFKKIEKLTNMLIIQKNKESLQKKVGIWPKYIFGEKILTNMLIIIF